VCERANYLTIRFTPDFNRAINAATREQFAVGAELNFKKSLRMTRKGEVMFRNSAVNYVWFFPDLKIKNAER
jgi:hypothetical protein